MSGQHWMPEAGKNNVEPDNLLHSLPGFNSVVNSFCLCLSSSLPSAPGRGLAFRGDSVQAGAVCPESLSGDHSAQSVRFEY